MASTAMGLVWGTSMFLKKASHSEKVTSCSAIQKAESSTVFCGPSSLSRPVSPEGEPIKKDPAGIGTILKLTAVPGIGCSYASRDCAKPEITKKTREQMETKDLTAKNKFK